MGKNANSFEAQDEPYCSALEDCGCATCLDNGPVVALQICQGIQFVGEPPKPAFTVATHKNGNAFAWYNWARTARRKPVVLRSTPGGLVPVRRDDRAEVVEELRHLYGMSEVLPKGRPRGSGVVTARQVVREVAGRLQGSTVAESLKRVANDHGCPLSTVRRLYYGKEGRRERLEVRAHARLLEILERAAEAGVEVQQGSASSARIRPLKDLVSELAAEFHVSQEDVVEAMENAVSEIVRLAGDGS
jgi:hypothetical protein